VRGGDFSWPQVGTFVATSGDLRWPPAGTFSWPRTFGHLPADESGQFDQLALPVAADMMPAAVFEKVEPTGHDWFAPGVDPTVHLNCLPTVSGPWILNHNRAHFANDGYASAEVALWDPDSPNGPALLA